MLAKMELPYRVIDTAAGDLGTSAARKFDCEAWLPSQNRYLELTSTSNCTTFQARRLKVRERTAEGQVRTAARSEERRVGKECRSWWTGVYGTKTDISCIVRERYGI